MRPALDGPGVGAYTGSYDDKSDMGARAAIVAREQQQQRREERRGERGRETVERQKGRKAGTRQKDRDEKRSTNVRAEEEPNLPCFGA